MRETTIERKTRETDITLWLNLDGGEYEIDTGCGFLNHMLELFASHSGFGLKVSCVGDTEVDFHHTVEDVGIALGTAYLKCVGDKKGMERYGNAIIPMDESLILCAVDVSGRSHLSYKVKIKSAKVTDESDEKSGRYVGLFDTELVEEFFEAFAREARVTLHFKKLRGKNTHHIIEAVFKSFARALKTASVVTGDKIPSSKGVL